METDGVYAPETVDAAQAAYDSLGSTAQIVVKETAKAMALGPEEYDDRITSDVIETARDALFASLLEVHHGDRDAFDNWCDSHPAYAVELLGSDEVDAVVWHPVPSPRPSWRQRIRTSPTRLRQRFDDGRLVSSTDRSSKPPTTGWSDGTRPEQHLYHSLRANVRYDYSEEANSDTRDYTTGGEHRTCRSRRPREDDACRSPERLVD
jgi:hypothetical protein